MFGENVRLLIINRGGGAAVDEEKNSITIKINADTSELDKALEKAQVLIKLLTEAKALMAELDRAGA